MRLGSFLMGGLLGAAAAMYYARTRKNNDGLFAGLLSAGTAILGKSKTGRSDTDSEERSSSNHAASPEKAVQELTGNDAELKQTVDAILSEQSSSGTDEMFRQ